MELSRIMADSITVESEMEKGTSFYVYLPTINAGDIKTNVEKLKIPLGSEHILIVDDEKSAVDSMRETLERLGYKITARTSSVEALEAFINDPGTFDLVITDMTMPNLTGKDLVNELKILRPDIPIILCTGFSDQISGEKTEKLSINAFIMKPIIRNEIAKTIREVLDKKKL